MEAYFNYVKDLTSIKSRIDLMAGYAINQYFTRDYAFATYTARGVKKAGSDPTFPFYDYENNLISYFGRLNYTLNNKYVLTATLRRDGSSKFGPGNKWGTFPALGLAWKIKEESFLKSNRLISDLKLRFGYGQTGQQDGIGNFIYLSYYGLSNFTAQYPFGVNYYQMYRPSGRNEGIKWEETTTYNAALDFGFWDNRITGSVDFYLKKTKDLLQSIPQPAGTNFSAFITANVGSMENRGVEFSINANPIRNKDLNWDIAFNATYNKNEITNLTVVPNDPNYKGFVSTNISGTQGFAFINAVGGSKNTFNLYHQIYQNGKPVEGLFEDVNRDGIINEDDKYKGKRADPNLFFGFSTNATWKKWNAGFVLRSSFNNYVYNNIYSNNGRLNQILNAYVLGNASRNYLETGFTGGTEQQPLSDYYIQNASFLKMDNFNIGYNFGQVLKQKATLRLNFSIQNVFVITKYTGLDPEIANGVDNNFYPRPRIYSLGIGLDL
jgi:iron complex outermembrane receptor protein